VIPVASRMTKQRKLILDILRSTTIHPTADWVFEQARKIISNISLSTVYRNLNILKNEGEIQELSHIWSFGRFDGNPQNHYHFFCKECGNVYDIDLPAQRQLDEEAGRISEMKIEGHSMLFFGLCHKCKKKS